MWLINFLKWFFGLGNNVAEPVQQRKSSCNDEDDFFSKQRQIVLEQVKTEVENFNSVPHEYYENINYMRFQGTAKYIATGRNRKIDKESFSEDELREQLIEDGYDKDSIVYHFVAYFAGKYFWNYNYEIHFDGNTNKDIEPNNILEIIPYLIDRYYFHSGD